MRLIDADELKRYINDCDSCAKCDDKDLQCRYCGIPPCLTEPWKRVIDDQQTVEAVPMDYHELCLLLEIKKNRDILDKFREGFIRFLKYDGYCTDYMIEYIESVMKRYTNEVKECD